MDIIGVRGQLVTSTSDLSCAFQFLRTLSFFLIGLSLLFELFIFLFFDLCSLLRLNAVLLDFELLRPFFDLCLVLRK